MSKYSCICGFTTNGINSYAGHCRHCTQYLISTGKYDEIKALDKKVSQIAQKASQKKAENERNSERKTKIGGGDRSEKIRTYNYPQNRVSDHRIGLTLQQLDMIMEGNLNNIFDALINADLKLKLEGQEL